jgi:hypothetical protein
VLVGSAKQAGFLLGFAGALREMESDSEMISLYMMNLILRHYSLLQRVLENGVMIILPRSNLT